MRRREKKCVQREVCAIRWEPGVQAETLLGLSCTAPQQPLAH